MAPKKFRWSIDGGDDGGTWNYEEEELPFNLSTVTVADTVIVEPIGDAVTISEAIYTPPAGLTWPTTVNGKTAPFGVTNVSGEWVAVNEDGSEFDPKTLVNDDIWTVNPYYVDPTKTDNTGNGLSWATAKRDINAAITLANGDGQTAMRIYCLAGDFYHQTRTINGSGNVEPTKHFALIASGGRVRHLASTAEDTWASAGSGVYTGGPASAVRVFDRINLDAYGNYTEITARADQAAVTAAAEGWADIGANLAVKRTDGLQPSSANTAVYRNLEVATFDANTTDGYIEGFDFEGGTFGAIYIGAVATRNFVLIDCNFRCAGNSTNMLDGMRARQTTGIIYINGGDSSLNAKDGWSGHIDAASGQMYMMLLNVTGHKNGAFSSTSNNLLTTHDAMITLVAGVSGGDSNTGADVHCIETTKTYIVGGNVVATANGGTNPTAYKVDGGTMWLENCIAASTDRALHAQGGTMYTRNVTITSGTELADSGGTIDTF